MADEGVERSVHEPVDDEVIEAARDDGESFAVLSLIGNGIHYVALFATDALLSNVAIKLGGRHLYTSFSFSFQPGDGIAAVPIQLARGSQRWGYGGGLGWQGLVGPRSQG